jgi:hypothetical protein
MSIAEVNETISMSNVTGGINSDKKDEGRGYQVYTMSQLMGISGKAKSGEMLTGYYEQPIFYLSLEERISIYRLCSPVFSVVTSRMNKISGMEWNIVSDKQNEDKIYNKLKTIKQVCDEYEKIKDMTYQVARHKLIQEIQLTLVDVLPDLSNFDKALLRWKRKIQSQTTDRCEWIKDWVMQPNINDKFTDITKKMIFDLMIHGAMSVYKEIVGNKIENVYTLPGGTIMPLKNKFVGGIQGYVQIMLGYQPQIMFANELAYYNYIPSTARSHGFIPLEALINKISESLLFDKLMADQADGTKMPEKMVIVANPSPFGNTDKEFMIPVNEDEQKRIEQKVNTPKKGAIMTFAGSTVQVVDLTRENTMTTQMQRQKDIREEVGIVFQATPMEMGLAGSENTSGRSTSESQEQIYHSNGVLPIVQILETCWNFDILPYRFGTGYKLEFVASKSEMEEMELMDKKIKTGLYSVNEIRVKDLNEDPFNDPQFDKPQGGGQPSQGQGPDQGQNPMGIGGGM